MRYSTKHKAETRRRIVTAAAGLIKGRGPEAVSVAEVMAAAGLTHGGFYAHFDSKDELIAETLREGRGASAERMRAAADRAGPGHELEAVLASYLSADHRAHVQRGCIVAALGSEAGRWDPQARQALAQRAQALQEAVSPYLSKPQVAPGGGTSDAADDSHMDDTARAVTACLVGGLILARIETDPVQAESMLAACRAFVVEALQGPVRPAPDAHLN